MQHLVIGHAWKKIFITNNDVRFTDNTYGGAVPYSSTFSYGELWLGSGTGTSGTVDLWANYPTGYIGISLTADETTQNIIFYFFSVVKCWKTVKL